MNAALHCTSCGVGTVLRFPGFRWGHGIDYYHVRNHCPDSRMPERTEADLAKLRTKLVPDAACAAFACGCSWQSIVGVKDLLDAVLGTPAGDEGGARLEADQMLRWSVPNSSSCPTELR